MLLDHKTGVEYCSEKTFAPLQPDAGRRSFRRSGTRLMMWAAVAGSAFLAMAGNASSQTIEPSLSIDEFRATAEEAYVYAFPMIVAYKVLHDYNVDRNSGAFLAPFNQLHNETRVFSPKDTTIVTPNSDTPYSMVQLDLRAEPMVICLPEVEETRYYDVQLTDMYTNNYGYMGSRTTGNGAGCHMVAGPRWTGETPKGIGSVFSSDTDFTFTIFRTQLFNAADMPNVEKVQAGYKVQPLSAFLGQPAPAAAPAIDWPALTPPPLGPTSRSISTSCCSSGRNPPFPNPNRSFWRVSRRSGSRPARPSIARSCRRNSRPRSTMRSRPQPRRSARRQSLLALRSTAGRSARPQAAASSSTATTRCARPRQGGNLWQ